MSTTKNTTNYFPRGNKKKSDGDSNFIFNTTKKVKKGKSREKSKLVTTQLKKRSKKHGDKAFESMDMPAAKATDDSDGLEEIETNSNTIPPFKPIKGSLLMMSVSEVYRGKYIICNHSRNKKGYMSAKNGHIVDKAVGDYVYAVVVATQSKPEDKSTQKKSNKLQLTDNLQVYNTFLSADKLVKGMQLRGIVERKEEKGYFIDLCFKDKAKAFLNFKYYEGPELFIGSQITVIVKSTKASSQKIVKCKHESTTSDISKTVLKGKTVNYEYIKPGFLVKCIVEKVADNGLFVNFCNGISGAIFSDHCKESLRKYKPKQELMARVITVDFEQKRIGLSELIVDLTPTTHDVKLGDILKNVKVISHVEGRSYIVEGTSLHKGVTVRCMLNKKYHAADVGIKKLNDKKRQRFENTKYTASQKLPGDIRITEFNYFDKMAIATSVAEQDEKTKISWDTLSGGDVIKVTIKEIVGDEYLNVSINDYMYGRLYKEQLTDNPQKHISKRLKKSIGQEIKVKVWRVVKDRKIIEFTMKESLMNEKVYVPNDFSDPRVANGTEITGLMSKEHSQGFILEFYNGLKGYLPTRILEKYNKKFAYTKGSMIQCFMLYKADKGLDLTISKEESVNYKPRTKGSKLNKKMESKIPESKVFVAGEQIKAIVTKFDPTKSFPLVLKLSDKQYGYVFFSDLGLTESDDLSSLKTIFEPGSLLEGVYVKNVKEQIDKDPRVECSISNPDKAGRKFDIGSKVLCRAVNIKPGFGATVQITFKQYGFIDVCEIEDDIVAGVDEILKEKVFFFARIIDVFKSKPQLSTRQTMLDDKSYGLLTNDCSSLEFKENFGVQKERGDLRNFIMKYHNWRQLLTENMIVRGYISTINQHGVFIKLARNFSVRASIKEITDSGPDVTATSFLSLNTAVLARITSFQQDKVHVSLRESILLYGVEEVDIAEVTPGVKAKLLVLTVLETIAYCQIIGSPYKCRVKLQKSDPKIEPDQKIIARVKYVDTSGKMPNITMNEVEECNEEHNQEYHQMHALIQQVKQVQAADHARTQVEEEDDEKNLIKQDIKELLENEDESENSEDNEEAKKITKYLKIDEDAEGEDEDEDEIMPADDEESDQEVHKIENLVQPEVSKVISETSKETTKKEKGKSMHNHIKDEIQIMLQERDLAESDHDDKYYERMLIAEPNDSFLWIHYISYALGKQGYEHAKTLCERAVKTIDITKLKEKLNLWTAYMNLEIKFGNEVEFKAIVQRALKVNDPKTIYLIVIDCYTKSKKNYQMIEAMYLVLTKKYNFHIDVWKRYFEFLFLAHHVKSNPKHEDHILLQDCDLTDKEKALSKSLQIITERKPQVELITKFSIEEYKYGNTEKGKTMLESIIHSYPKRTDIISTYLDMEIKYVKRKQNIRNLFDKLLNRENVKINQVKFLFKRYMEFEVANGSEKDVERVKEKAAEFAAKIGKGAESEGEQSESDNEPEQVEEAPEADEDKDDEMDVESSEESE